MRAIWALLSAVGWSILSALSLAGLGTSALVLAAAVPVTRPMVAGALVRYAGAEVAGRFSLGGVDVLPGGAFAIRDFKAFDPDGKLVLEVDRLLVAADVTRLRNKTVGLEMELEGAAVLVDEDPAGRLSLARAFAPAHPANVSGRQATWEDLGGWTIQLRRLTVRDTSVWWRDASGMTRVELQDSVARRTGRGRAASGAGRAVDPWASPGSRERADGPGSSGPARWGPTKGPGAVGAARGHRSQRIGRAGPGEALRPRHPHSGRPRPCPGTSSGGRHPGGSRPRNARLR